MHAGCLGNINATWTFHGRSGHSARPWLADNAIERAAAGIAALAAHGPQEHEFDGLTFTEVASVTQIAGGIAENVIPDRVECHVNYRYAPGRTAGGRRGASARAVRRPRRARRSTPTPRRARSRTGNPLVAALRDAAGWRSSPSRRGRRSRSSPRPALDAVNFGPGEPRRRTAATSRSRSPRSPRAYRVLEALGGAR